jgi:hypothetical protein
MLGLNSLMLGLNNLDVGLHNAVLLIIAFAPKCSLFARKNSKSDGKNVFQNVIPLLLKISPMKFGIMPIE